MPSPSSLPVLVIGAGPVGLALSLDLARRGNDSILIEPREGDTLQPRMDMVSVRTMEFCRRWGLVEAVEAAGFNRDLPQDIVYATSVLGHELNRDTMPSMAAEPKPAFSPQKRERCPQNFFDPVLRRAVLAEPRVQAMFGWRLDRLSQDPEGVTAVLQRVADGCIKTVRGAFLAGCDGGGSRVRSQLGIGGGDGAILTFSTSILVHSPALSAQVARPAYRHVLIGPEGLWASLVRIDGRDVWRLQIVGGDRPELMDEAAARQAVVRAFGGEVPFEVLSIDRWVRREMVADRYREGRCFLVGDAAHLMSPTGGYGMNTGIADAVDLGWKLSATLAGWGGPALLDSYELERRPVALRNVAQASANLGRMRDLPAYPAILDPGEAGDADRAAAGQAVPAAMREEWRSIGVHIGYSYDGSPLTVADGTPAAPPEVVSYTPNARPGSRAPHAWLADGRSTLDLLGDGFSLWSAGEASASGLMAAAAARNVPVELHAVGDHLASILGAALTLVRPDGHVAWRGDASPEDPGAVLDQVRGASGISAAPSPGTSKVFRSIASIE